MRILHTSDWHLGRQFHGLPLDEDHDVILDQIAEAIEQKKPDVLIIAGDIFDRVSPPQSALTRFGDFIKRVTLDNDLAVVAIAGAFVLAFGWPFVILQQADIFTRARQAYNTG